MKNSGKKAFTLVELLVGMIMMLLVLGGVVATLRSGLDLFFKSEANGKVTNGVRFTVDTFDRVISPLLANATEVEILSDKSKIPSTLNELDHYVYLSGDKVMHRTTTSDDALEGSEYIKSLSFAMTKTSKDVAQDWTVSVDIAGEVPTYTAAKVAVSMDKMLMNVQKKSGGTGTAVGDLYQGSVLHFVAQSEVVDFKVIIDKINIIDGDGNILTDKETDQYVNINNIKQNKIKISYDIRPSVDPHFKWVDKSTVKWYICGSPAVAKNIDKITTITPTDDNRTTKMWLLVKKSDKSTLATTSNDSVPTGAEYSVSCSSSANTGTSWGSKYGTILCLISPKIGKAGTLGNDKTADDVFSPSVTLQNEHTTSGNSLWMRWGSILGSDATAKEGFYLAPDATGQEYKNKTYTTNGVPYLTITGSKNGPIATVALMQVDLLDDIAEKVSEDNVSYTTLTNYSVIVDANIGKGNGWGLLINGTSKSDDKHPYLNDNGYVFQCDRAMDSLLFRVRSMGYEHGPSEADEGYEQYSKYIGARLYDGNISNDSYSSGYNLYMSGYARNYSDFVHYGPGFLKTTTFDFNSKLLDYYGNADARTSSYPWTSRQRVMLTVLEYYMNGTGIGNGKEYPRFIVRVKYLSDDSQVESTEYAKDEWHIGNKFFKSEPAWYGDFVGDAAVSKDNGKYATDYSYTINNYQHKSAEALAFTHTAGYVWNSSRWKWDYIDEIGDEKESHYIINAHYLNSGYVSSAFTAQPMDIGMAIAHSSFNSTKYRGNTQFQNPKRPRYLGLRIWQTDKDDTTNVQIYSVNYAPGFTKKELQAIMPEGAKMYETNETGQDDYYTDAAIRLQYKTLHGNGNMNGKLFSNSKSDGVGNGTNLKGVMQIQHHSSSCNCPMCTNFPDK